MKLGLCLCARKAGNSLSACLCFSFSGLCTCTPHFSHTTQKPSQQVCSYEAEAAWAQGNYTTVKESACDCAVTLCLISSQPQSSFLEWFPTNFTSYCSFFSLTNLTSYTHFNSSIIITARDRVHSFVFLGLCSVEVYPVNKVVLLLVPCIYRCCWSVKSLEYSFVSDFFPVLCVTCVHVCAAHMESLDRKYLFDWQKWEGKEWVMGKGLIELDVGVTH